MVWGIIAIASLRFHAAVEKQQDQLFSEIFAWRAWCFPAPSVWLLICSIFLLVCCIHTGIKPLVCQKINFHAEQPTNRGNRARLDSQLQPFSNTCSRCLSSLRSALLISSLPRARYAGRTRLTFKLSDEHLVKRR